MSRLAEDSPSLLLRVRRTPVADTTPLSSSQRHENIIFIISSWLMQHNASVTIRESFSVLSTSQAEESELRPFILNPSVDQSADVAPSLRLRLCTRGLRLKASNHHQCRRTPLTNHNRQELIPHQLLTIH